MADEIAVWLEPLTARQIAALAPAQSPSHAAPAADDEAGIPDGYELALVGNLPDLTAGGDGDDP
ncbi:MAG: hypothetical protein VX269_01015, partial [Verrucomicrobiota bacterium]|nr:hypothetical protein [Verrucomicrobiota bacterium]